MALWSEDISRAVDVVFEKLFLALPDRKQVRGATSAGAAEELDEKQKECIGASNSVTDA